MLRNLAIFDFSGGAWGSAPGNAHVTRDRGALGVDAEFMAERLARDQLVERRVDARRPAGTQQIAQFDSLVMAEATEDRASRGNPDAVAAGAEIVGERGDQAKLRLRPGELEIARRPASAVQGRDQGELLGERVLDAVERQIMTPTKSA